MFIVKTSEHATINLLLHSFQPF